MGFWHTGYAEFHEDVGLNDALISEVPTVRYQCGECEATFESLEALRTHRFNEHPLQRPVLLIRGAEIQRHPLVITTPLLPSDVAVLSAESAVVNGTPVSASAIGATLARRRRGTARITFPAEAERIPRTIHFMIATPTDLDGVEHCFSDIAARRRLDRPAVEQFITSAKRFKTASTYYDGICEYLYGVMAKERSREIDVRYERYREKLNRSLNGLWDIRRALASHISSLIEFNFNLMKNAAQRDPQSRVAIASRRLRLLGEGDIASLTTVATPRTAIDRDLTDVDTEAIIAWACQSVTDLVRNIGIIDRFSQRPLAEFDKTKCHIILAAVSYHMGDRSRALTYARELHHLDNDQLSARGLIHVIKAASH